MSPYSATDWKPRSAFPNGRYLQADTQADISSPIPLGPASPVPATQDEPHIVPADSAAEAPMATAERPSRRRRRMPWTALVIYPVALLGGLGFIYLAYRLHLTQHVLFPVMVAAVTLLALIGMFLWGLREERLARERRQRLRLGMAGTPYSQAGENPARHLYERGMELINLGECEEAIVYFRKALQINTNYVEAYQALGTAYNVLGEPELAVEMTQRAFEIKVQGYGDKS